MKWNDVFATKFEDLNITKDGERIERKRKLKYGGILVSYKSAKTGEPKVAVYFMEEHSTVFFLFQPFMPNTYYDKWADATAAQEKELVAEWEKQGAAKKKEAGKRKCEADRAARHGKKQHFQIFDERHPYRW